MQINRCGSLSNSISCRPPIYRHPRIRRHAPGSLSTASSDLNSSSTANSSSSPDLFLRRRVPFYNDTAVLQRHGHYTTTRPFYDDTAILRRHGHSTVTWPFYSDMAILQRHGRQPSIHRHPIVNPDSSSILNSSSTHYQKVQNPKVTANNLMPCTPSAPECPRCHNANTPTSSK